MTYRTLQKVLRDTKIFTTVSAK